MEPEFRDFAVWAARYISTSSRFDRRELQAEGHRLVEARRVAMRRMIRENPRRALELGMSNSIRRRLPAEIAGRLEQPVSGRGSLSVFAALPEPGKEREVTPVVRVARIQDADYDAYVYGRREGEPSRVDTAMHGIVVDGVMAIHEDPIRRLDAGEIPAYLSATREPRCAISGELVAATPEVSVVELAGRTIPLCGPAHVGLLNDQAIQAESGPSGGFGVGTDEVQASAYTEGLKRLLLIRVDFSDLAGSPFPDSTGVSLIAGLNDFYREASFTKTGFALHGSGSAMTPTLRMPQPASHYGGSDAYTQLRADARSAAAAAGFNLANYDFDLICFGAVPGWGWAGLGYVGAPGVWLRGYFTVGVAAHELGHNLGLNHAGFWDTQGESIRGTNGVNVEYGDVFDTMGTANAGPNHFNARYKAYLNWLTSSETLTVSSSGTYRLYAHDDTNSTGIRGLKIVRDSGTNYWVEFRTKFPGNAWMRNGVGLRWAGNGNQKSRLLDTTPGSANGKNDSALVIGRTFSDPAYGIHVTPIRRLGTSPDAVDVVVNFGTFPLNTPPVASLSTAGNSVAPGATLTLSAVASDPDGDTLAYHWDFGDGTFGTNGAVAGKSWTSTGEYVVQCTVSDMKGGTARDSMIVTVGFPGTYRISGRISLAGNPVQGARVYVSGSRMAYTDSDGTYVLAGLPPSAYTVSVSLEGHMFTPFGFANPVNVGPSANGIDFNAALIGSAAIAMSQPLAGQTFVSPTNILLSALAVPAAGSSLSRVDFYQGATRLGQDATAPYSLTWTNPTLGNQVLRAVAVESGGQMRTSPPVSVVVVPLPPVIVAQPQSVTSPMGSNVTFAVTASGAGGLTYQWRHNGSNIAGATQTTLTLSAVQSTQAGDYRVAVSNSGGAVTSAVATLTIVQAPFITTQPQGQTNSIGTTAMFTVQAIGTGPLRYQWTHNNSALPNATNSSYTIPAVVSADAGEYAVVISNGVGVASSDAARLIVNCAVSLSATGAAFTAESSSGSFNIAAHSSCSWTITGVPTWLTIASSLAGNGNALMQYNVASNAASFSRSAVLDVSGVSYRITQAAADRTAPSVAIMAPAPNSTVNDPIVAVSGTAADNESVSVVEYRVGTNSYEVATGTTAWSGEVGLAPGTNIIAVRCRDTSGNISPEVRQTILCAPASTITILTTGQGTIRGATNGQRLQIGRRYSLTAIPAAGFAFSNWSGGVATSWPKVDFEMQSNLVLVAHFVPNPFIAARGAFNGLFYEAAEVNHERAGFFTFVLTDRGSYSGSLLFRGTKLGVSGRLDLEGKGTNHLLLRDGISLTILWSVNMGDPERLDGVVTDGAWTAILGGDRAPSPHDRAVDVGNYTFVVLGNPTQGTAPGGDGYGTVSVDAKGSARLKGFLADNTRFAAKAPVSKTGQWPCYASLYKKGGAVLGWVNFRDRPTTDLDGVLSWTRPALPGAKLYADGFTSESAIIGSRYQAAGALTAMGGMSTPLLRWGGGNLAHPLTNQVAISGNTVQNLGLNPLNMRVSASSGLFSGVVGTPMGQNVTFKGAILPKANFGSGYFVGTNQTGVVVFESTP